MVLYISPSPHLTIASLEAMPTKTPLAHQIPQLPCVAVLWKLSIFLFLSRASNNSETDHSSPKNTSYAIFLLARQRGYCVSWLSVLYSNYGQDTMHIYKPL